MKTLKNTLLIGLVMLLLSSLSQAQDFDTDRMNRDIKIMERVLDDIFKTNAPSNIRERSLRVFTPGTSSSNTKGTYIPGYGVIFKIPAITSSAFTTIRINNIEDDTELTFYYDDEEGEAKEVTEETITNRIIEFLQDYAVNIGQLKPSENIKVVYGMKGNSNQAQAFIISQLRDDEKERVEKKPIPRVSVITKKKDLDDYRLQKISSGQFSNRLTIQEPESPEILDLKVMSNIFQTAFESEHKLALINKDPSEAFRLMGDVAYEKLEGFGVIFSFNARYADNSRATYFELREIGFPEPGDSVQELRVMSDSARKQAIIDRTKKVEDRATGAYNEFKDQLRQYLVDYGRTLRSVESDKAILVSVDITSLSVQSLPDRLDLKISKSTLEDFDAGKISREEAINAVTLTEY